MRGSLSRAFPPLPVPLARELGIERGDLETGWLACEWTKKGLRHDEVKGKEYLKNHTTLFFLSPVGVRYYLPGFMQAALSESSEHMIHDTLIRTLWLRGPKATWDRAQLKALSTDQVVSICQALRALCEYQFEGKLGEMAEQCASDWSDYAIKRGASQST